MKWGGARRDGGGVRGCSPEIRASGLRQGSVELARGKRREKAALGGNCKGCRLQVGRRLATAWAKRGRRGAQRGHVGSSSSGENPTTMGSHGRKGFEQGSSKIRRAGKSKNKMWLLIPRTVVRHIENWTGTPSFHRWRHWASKMKSHDQEHSERYWQNFLFLTLGPVFLFYFYFSTIAPSTL